MPLALGLQAGNATSGSAWPRTFCSPTWHGASPTLRLFLVAFGLGATIERFTAEDPRRFVTGQRLIFQ